MADAESNFISDAGLRCESPLDSKTTFPVLKSISETDGFRSSGATANFANTFTAEAGSIAEALGIANKLAERMAA